MFKLGVLDDIKTEYIYDKNHNHFYIKEIHNMISRVRDVHINKIINLLSIRLMLINVYIYRSIIILK